MQRYPAPLSTVLEQDATLLPVEVSTNHPSSQPIVHCEPLKIEALQSPSVRCETAASATDTLQSGWVAVLGVNIRRAISSFVGNSSVCMCAFVHLCVCLESIYHMISLDPPFFPHPSSPSQRKQRSECPWPLSCRTGHFTRNECFACPYSGQSAPHTHTYLCSCMCSPCHSAPPRCSSRHRSP